MDPQTKIILEKMEEMRSNFKKQTEELAEKLSQKYLLIMEEKLKPIIQENT